MPDAGPVAAQRLWCRWNGFRRAGAATIDYVLVLGVIMPLAGFILVAGPKIMRLVYEMLCGLVAWPFM